MPEDHNQVFRQRNGSRNSLNHTNFNLDANGNVQSDIVLNDLNYPPVPPPAQSAKTAELADKSRKYWSQNFFVVLIPFILLGFPVHIVLACRKKDKEKTREELNEDTWAYWFNFRFGTVFSAALSIILLPWCLAINVYAFWKVVSIFDHLVIQGVFTDQETGDALSFAYMSPYLVMMNYAWLYGHNLNSIIQTFGRPVTLIAPSSGGNSKQRIVSINDNHNEIDSARSEASYELNTDAEPEDQEFKDEDVLSILTDVEVSNFRMNLAITYTIAFCAYILHYFVTRHRRKFEDWTDARVLNHWINYLYTVTYSLMLLVYHCICGAILCKLHNLNRFIKKTIHRGDKMQLVHIYLIKKAYKVIADSILRVNSVCRVFLSVVIFAFYSSSGIRASDLITFLIQRLASFYEDLVDNTIQPNSTSGMSVAIEPQMSSGDVGVPPDVVRYYVAVGVESLIYVYLMRSTVWKAIQVNDESRYLIVRLNELATELAFTTGHRLSHADNDHLKLGKEQYVDADVYRAFKLLKLYVHSRMEAHGEYQQALLSIFGFIFMLPGMPMMYRLSGYNLIH